MHLIKIVQVFFLFKLFKVPYLADLRMYTLSIAAFPSHVDHRMIANASVNNTIIRCFVRGVSCVQ